MRKSSRPASKLKGRGFWGFGTIRFTLGLPHSAHRDCSPSRFNSTIFSQAEQRQKLSISKVCANSVRLSTGDFHGSFAGVGHLGDSSGIPTRRVGLAVEARAGHCVRVPAPAKLPKVQCLTISLTIPAQCQATCPPLKVAPMCKRMRPKRD